MKKILLISALSIFAAVSGMKITFAATQSQVLPDPIPATSAYRSFKDIPSQNIKVPTVVQLPFENVNYSQNYLLLVDKTTSKFEPTYFIDQNTQIRESVVSKLNTSGSIIGSDWNLSDNDATTFSDFPLPSDTKGNVTINIFTDTPITSSALLAQLDQNVALPSSVEVSAEVQGQNRIVVGVQRMNDQIVRFPETTSKSWTIKFTYSQPLRISEIKLIQDNSSKNNFRAVRFLSQPAHDYRLYFNPDRYVSVSLPISGNLSESEGVLKLPTITSSENPSYVLSDVDGDGIPDNRDNCINSSNPDQADLDNNGRGDVCDDYDRDGIVNSKDNCPNNPNPDQIDTDVDGIGDVCDSQESRITEQYKWVPWVGMSFAALVLIGLLILMFKPLIKFPKLKIEPVVDESKKNEDKKSSDIKIPRPDNS